LRSALVIEADDLGLARPFNEGIRRAATEGWLTSTCIRTNGTAVEEAFDDVLPACPHIGLGVHLNIVEGRTTRPNVGDESELCTADGRYKCGFVELLRAGRSSRLLAEIEADFRHQIETVLGRRQPDHLNGHQHCHLAPPIFDIVCRLAKEYAIPFVRIPYERIAFAGLEYPWTGVALNTAKTAVVRTLAPRLRPIAASHGVRANDSFVGLLYSGYMDERSITRGLSAVAGRNGIVELLVHPTADPGRPTDAYLPGTRDYTLSPYRARELRAVSQADLADRLQRLGFELTNFGALAGRAVPHRPLRPPPPGPRPRLRVVAVIDETTFYHPQYLRRLVQESEHADIVAVARVCLPHGGTLPAYLLRNVRLLGIRELSKLGAKQLLLQLGGLMPRRIRGEYSASVRSVAERFGIPHRTVTTVRDEQFRTWVRSFDPDVVLSANSLIFPEALIEVPRIATINRHTALLPSYGGVLPVFRAIQRGEKWVGASVHVMTPAIDEGPVISRKWLPVERGDSLDRLYELGFNLSVDATEEAFGLLRKHGRDTPPLPDDGLVKSYYSFPGPEDWREFREHGGRFI
jgi:predicted glycoside hydrolase/deacetylase ChbG (UPF0249 family)